MSLGNDGLPLPDEKDFKERVDADIAKGIPIEMILKDTENLIREFEWTAVRCNYQAMIYKDLKAYIENRIKFSGKE